MKAAWGALKTFCARLGLGGRRPPEDGEAELFFSTETFLQWRSGQPQPDEALAARLESLLNQGPKAASELKPAWLKLLPQLARLGRRHGGSADIAALRAYGLELLSRLESQSAAARIRPLERRRWHAALGLLRQAIALAPRRGDLAAEAGRLMQQRAELLAERPPEAAYYLNQALDYYRRALDLGYGEPGFWLRLARLLARLAAEAEGGGLSWWRQALYAFEMARRESGWDGAFYLDFGRAAAALAELEPQRKAHYLNYAARLLALAAEKLPDEAAPLLERGQALAAQALILAEERKPQEAEALQRQALDCFQQAARLEPAEPRSRLWAAASLAALYKLADSEELLEQAQELCAQACALARTEELWAQWAEILSLLAEARAEGGALLWTEAAEKYAQAARLAADKPRQAALHWHNCAYCLSCRAQLSSSESESRALLTEALDRYRQALELDELNPISLKNTAELLVELALLEPEEKKRADLYCQSEALFAKAVELYPDQAGPQRRWGQSLMTRARAELDPGVRGQLWAQALDKLRAASQAQPNDAPTWSLWGQALAELSWERPDFLKPMLLAEAMEKFERALALEPDDDQSWSELGQLCLQAAELPDSPSQPGAAQAAAQMAGKHFQRACDLKPRLAERWADWGRARLKSSQLADNSASALAALQEAYEKYETAAALAPDNSEYRARLCQVSYEWGWHLQEPGARLEQFKRAYEHGRRAYGLAPHDPLICRGWGQVSEALAAVELDPAKSGDWQREAEEKYYRAAALEADGGRWRRH